jgi:tetratricopeptide (TPR) repeat protein
MKRPQLVSRGTVNRMLQAADEAWIRRDFQQSIDLLERATRLDPANPLVQMNLGRFYGLRYDYAAAERCFEKAIRVASNKAEAFTEAGKRSREFDTPAMAERYFQKAVAQPDASSEACTRLAEIYERQHRLEEAGELIDRALGLNPGNAMALLGRARLDRQANRLGDAERRLRSIPPGAERETRALACYELGSVLDRQKRYDEAMAAFLEAKSILRLDAAPHINELKVVRERLKLARESLTPETLQRWADQGAQLQPSRRLALLAGHPRSGTTLLEQVLDAHPDIVSSEETMIFHDYAFVPLRRGFEDPLMLPVLEAASVEALRQARAAYFQAIELSLGSPLAGRLLVDKNPSYTFLIPALVRIFPEIKLLIALRDPRDVCLSVFMQPLVPLKQGNAGYLSLASTVDDYVELMSMWRTLARIIKNPYLEIRYEDIVESLADVAPKVLSFLDVPWDARILKFDEHARGKMVRSPTYADVAKPVFKTAMGRWRNYQKYLEPHLEKLEPFVKAFGYE